LYILLFFIYTTRTFLPDVRTKAVFDDLNLTIEHDGENFTLTQICTQCFLLGRGGTDPEAI